MSLLLFTRRCSVGTLQRMSIINRKCRVGDAVIYVNDNRVLCRGLHRLQKNQEQNSGNPDAKGKGNRHNNSENFNPLSKMRQRLRDLHDLPESNQEPQRLEESQRDFAGEDTEPALNVSEEMVGKVDTAYIRDTFSFLQKSIETKSEKVMDLSFGIVRLDSSNIQRDHRKNNQSPDTDNKSDYANDKVPNYTLNSMRTGRATMETNSHAKGRDLEHSKSQIFNNNENSNVDIDSRNKMNFFDEHYFPGEELHLDKPGNGEQSCMEQNKKPSDNLMSMEDVNMFDEHYFKQPPSDKSVSIKREQIPDGHYFSEKPSDKSMSVEEWNLFDEHYFSKTKDSFPVEGRVSVVAKEKIILEPNKNQQNRNLNDEDSNFFDTLYFANENDQATERSYANPTQSSPKRKDVLKNSQKENANARIPDRKQLQSDSNDFESKNIVIEKATKQELRMSQQRKTNLEKPETPFDMAMKIRKELKYKKSSEDTDVDPKRAKWTGQTDSHGFRILQNQTLDIQNQSAAIVVKILKDSILYEDDEMLAVDKPYGLPSHGGPGVHHSVGQYLENLACLLHPKLEQLYLVHRLDKETTGVMLIAKNAQSQQKLHRMFLKRLVIKKYWCLTKGVPSPLEGVIDIPMAEGTVNDKYRMTLRPVYSPEQRLMVQVHSGGSRQQAITNFKVLDSNHHVALIECQPETGVKHQIRCHMAFALNTPILGDHKYSNFSKLAPQKLHPETLQRLKIRQAKVRHLAMHLHAKQLILPEYDGSRNIFISSSLPRHFTQNMKWLEISPPNK